MQSVLEVLNKCSAYFAEKGVPEPKLDAQILLAQTLKCKRLELFLQFEKPMTEQELSIFRELAKRRAKREPLQHILGEVEFFGLKLKSDARALIPRPETEELVDIITSRYFLDPTASLEILELGTGTGAIALALASHFKNAKVMAVDFSDNALSLARENTELCDIKNIEIRKSDWFENVEGKFDLIVANPPYLTDKEVALAEREVRDFDPHSALIAPDEGMGDLRKILKSAPNFMKEKALIACECGLGQPQKLADEFSSSFADIETLPDLSHRIRYFLARK